MAKTWGCRNLWRGWGWRASVRVWRVWLVFVFLFLLHFILLLKVFVRDPFYPYNSSPTLFAHIFLMVKQIISIYWEYLCNNNERVKPKCSVMNHGDQFTKEVIGWGPPLKFPKKEVIGQ